MSTTYKYDDELLRANGLKLVDGKLSSGDQYIYDKAKIQKQIAGLEEEASRAVAQTHAAAQISPEMEQANILREKTKKYMPTMMKQAGLSGLGVAQSAMLQAQNDHLNRMNALKRERDKAAGAASDSVAEAYRRYIEELEGKSADLDLTKAKTDIEGVYGENGWSNAQREAEFGKILGRYSGSPEVQNTLLEYAKTYQADRAVIDELYGLLGIEGGKDAHTIAGEYLEVAEGMDADGGDAEDTDFWENVDLERVLALYGSASENAQATIDDHLEARGAMSVEDKAEEIGKQEEAAAKIDARIEARLNMLGGDWKPEDIQAILESERFAGMSDNMRERLENLLEDEEFMRDRFNVPDEKELAVIENAFNSLLDPDTGSFSAAATPDKLVGFLTKYPNAPKDRLEAAQNQLAAIIYGNDASADEMKVMTDEEADAYIENLRALVNEDETPKTELISEEFYKSYVKPEIDEFKSVLGAYRAEADRIASETYQKQMAGEKPVVVNGKKWYVANSPEGDVEAFMKENKEAVNEALGEYGNAKNPSIPDGTVIKVNGASLYYDKTGDSWCYLAENPTENSVTPGAFGMDDKAYKDVIVHGIRLRVGDDGTVFRSQKVGASILSFVKKKDLELIHAEVGENVTDGYTVEVRNGRKAVHFSGKWYYLK